MTSISTANAGDSANLRPLLLSIPEARRHLGAIGNTKFYRTVRDYRIQLVRLGGRSLVPMAEVERVVSELTRSPTGTGAVRERAVGLARRSIEARRRPPRHE